VGQPKRFTKLPPLSERVLPNLDIIIQGKDLIGTARYSPGVLELQKGYDWTGEGQIIYQPACDDPVLEMDFNIEKEEYRGLMLRLTYADDYGIYRIYLDSRNIRQPDDYMAGDKIEDYDLYSPNLKVRDHYLGSFKLAPGKHTLRFECVGRNPFSKGDYLGIDSVRLRERWNRKR
jgi:hypothetical protein